MAERGRPTEYKPEYCDELIEHMAKGLSFESFAGVVGVSRKTIYNWCEANQDFLHAKEVGVEKCRLFWEKLGIDHIINITEYESDGSGTRSSSTKSLNSSVYGLNMKNRFNWREKQPGEEDRVVTHKGEVTVKKIDLDERISQLKGTD